MSDSGIECAPVNTVWGFDHGLHAISSGRGCGPRRGKVPQRDWVRIRMAPSRETQPRDHLAADRRRHRRLASLPAPRIVEDAPSNEDGDIYVIATYTPSGGQPQILVVGDFLSVRTTSTGTYGAPVERKHFAAFGASGYGTLSPLIQKCRSSGPGDGCLGRHALLGGELRVGLTPPARSAFSRDSLAAFDLTKDMHTSFSLSLDAGVNALDIPGERQHRGRRTLFHQSRQAEELRVVPSWPRITPDGTVLPWTSPPFGKVFDIDVEGGPACGLAPSDSCILTGQADVPGQHVPNKHDRPL